MSGKLSGVVGRFIGAASWLLGWLVGRYGGPAGHMLFAQICLAALDYCGGDAPPAAPPSPPVLPACSSRTLDFIDAGADEALAAVARDPSICDARGLNPATLTRGKIIDLALQDHTREAAACLRRLCGPSAVGADLN